MFKPIKWIAITILILLLAQSAFAQRGRRTGSAQPPANIPGQTVQIGGTAGWMLGGKSAGYNIANDWNYHLFLTVPVKPGVKAEVSYTRQNTELRDEVGAINNKLFDLSVEYLQVGAQMEIPKGQVAPFGMFTLGAIRYNPDSQTLGDEWRFAIALGGGAKVYVSPKIGLRLQARLLMPIMFAGGGFWCGSGSGCGVGLGAGSHFVQLDLGAGLFIAL